MNVAAASPDRIVKLGYAFRESKVLLSAVELDVFSALAHAPLNCGSLRLKIGIAERGARDFFDALVALDLLKRDKHGLYSNTQEAEQYLDRKKDTYIGGELEHIEERTYPHWNLLSEALRTGRSQSESRDTGYFNTLYADQKTLEIFARGMTGGTLPAARALAEKFPWHEYRTVVDVGTAQGCLPVQIAAAHPHLTGGGFDLPPIRPVFEAYVRDHNLSDRLHFYPGDFLSDRLPVADVIVMGRVLHNWDLITKKLLLAKAMAALTPGGALVIHERLIDDDRRVNTAGFLASLNMLIMTNGGFDFSAADCIGWMDEAGFQNMRVEPLESGQSMIIGSKL
jgi:hypothetical protein